jgi:hypothetical protein
VENTMIEVDPNPNPKMVLAVKIFAAIVLGVPVVLSIPLVIGIFLMPSYITAMIILFKTPLSELGQITRTTRNRQRMPIPTHVKREVWQRDQGHCVSCGSNENLEYDHIIPWSRGGADTVRNLQLLCQTCNRRKGARI